MEYNINQNDLKYFPSIVAIFCEHIYKPCFISDNLADILGLGSAKILEEEKDFTKLIHQDDVDEYKQQVNKFYQSELKSLSLKPFRIKTVKQNYIWISELRFKKEKDQDNFSYAFITDITSQVEKDEQVRREQQALALILDLAIHAKDVKDLCRRVLKGLINVLSFNYGSIRLLNHQTGKLNPVAVIGLDPGKSEKLVPIIDQSDDYYISSQVVKTKQPIFAPIIKEHPIYTTHKNRVEELDIEALISCPILDKHNQLVGLINLVSNRNLNLSPDRKIFFNTVTDMFSMVLEKKSVEDKLVESEQKYRKMVDMSPEAIAVHKNGILKYVNKAGADMLGIEDVSSYIGESIQQFIHPDYRKLVEQRVYTMISEKTEVPVIEEKFLKADGTPVDVAVQAAYFPFEGEQAIQVVFQDITKRKQSEQQIRHLNKVLKAIRNINQLITHEKDRNILLKKIGEILTFQRGYRSTLIILVDRYLNTTFSVIIGANEENKKLLELCEQSIIPPCFQKALKKRISIVRSPSDNCKNCSIKDVYGDCTRITAALEHSGTVYGFLSVISDRNIDQEELDLFLEMSEDLCYALHDIELEEHRKKIEKEYNRIERLESLGTLAGGIAHDFNNILTGIMGNISVIKFKADQHSQFLLQEALKACYQAKNLTKQLLTFSSGGDPIIETASIPEIIKDSAEFALRGSNVKCNYHFSDNLWMVNIDKGQINQVVHNLIINADQAMPRGGEVDIYSENVELKKEMENFLPPGRYVEIKVQDQGTGIDPENFSKIFDPYFSTKKDGSGLGLATTHSIIKKHKGYITAQSVVGEGTTFIIYLPAAEKTITKPEPQILHITDIPPDLKILLMDDEKLILNTVKNILESYNIEVDCVDEGYQAVEKYRELLEQHQGYDAVILDLTVPGGMGGRETVKAILEIDPEARIIASSGYSNDPLMANYLEYGFKGVILKPYTSNDLMRVIIQTIKSK